MKHIFIINPISGTKKFNQYMDYIEETMKDRKLEYEIILTQYEKHASTLASKYDENDDVTLYVFGGDGTVHEVINGIKPNIPLAIIPVGTGNDFYRYFQTDLIRYILFHRAY
jgi:diacylglycerol kinase family enzyme